MISKLLCALTVGGFAKLFNRKKIRTLMQNLYQLIYEEIFEDIKKYDSKLFSECLLPLK